MLLENKVVLVSGIGPGLGRATALAAARHGADVVLAARTESRLTQVATEVEAVGRRALPVVTDISLQEDCTALVARTMEEFGCIDVLVNNAFKMPPFEPLTEQAVATIQDTFEVNVFAPMRLSQAVVPHMSAAGGGSIVMINSVILRQQKPAYGAYKMAKHSLLGLARSLAVEVGPMNIRVNSVAPGFIGAAVVDLVAQIEATERGVSPEKAKEQILESLMLRRAPEPGEIAEAVVFFASDMSRSITGQCLDVNSGQFTH